MPLGVGQTIHQGLKGILASAYPSRQSDPLQHCRGGNEHIGRPQMCKHCLDDRFAVIGGPRSVRAHLQAGPPIDLPEVPQPEMQLQFDRVLPTGLIPERIVGKYCRRYAELPRHKDDHRLWRVLVRTQALARIPEEAQLDGEPKPVDGPPLRSDDGQVFGAEHVVSRHLGGIDRDGEQACALFR